MQFNYKAATFDGKLQQGQLAGESEKVVVAKLQKQGLVPLHLEAVKTGYENAQEVSENLSTSAKQAKKSFGSGILSMELSKMGRKPGNKELIRFAEHLSIMLKAGITLNKSLKLLSELAENKNFSLVISDIHGQIREGTALWRALQKHMGTFPKVFVNMVKAGESGGILDAVLEKTAEYLNDMQELKEFIVSAMIYPVILGVTCLASVFFMLIFVVPKFAEIFQGMGVDLPLATQMMLNVGVFFKSYWWVVALLLFLVVFAFKALTSRPAGQLKWDNLKLNLPGMGIIIKKLEISRFSRTLSTLLDSGLSILPAMNIVKGVVMNTALQQGLDNVYNDLKQGRMLSVALEKREVFPRLATNMLSVGEESGALAGMLNKVSEIYDKDLKGAIKSFTAIFEPVLILTMGLVIGVMVVSMLMAIFSINQLGV